jgi:hypothetical protein
VNSSVAAKAGQARANASDDLILNVFILLNLLVNLVAIIALNTGGSRKSG